MYKEILRSIGGIDVYPIVSLFIFVTFFTLAIVRALRMDARSANEIAALPLDGAALNATGLNATALDAAPRNEAPLNGSEVAR